jgi:hypothetical protein
VPDTAVGKNQRVVYLWFCTENLVTWNHDLCREPPESLLPPYAWKETITLHADRARNSRSQALEDRRGTNRHRGDDNMLTAVVHVPGVEDKNDSDLENVRDIE